MTGWRDALKRTRDAWAGRLGAWLPGRVATSAEELETLEEMLLRADVAPAQAMRWVDQLRAPDGRRAALEKLLLEALGPPDPWTWKKPEERPLCLLLVGVNGSGKTTTCAKLAQHARRRGWKPLLAAADTFRAAGADQLRLWAERLDCDVVAGTMGADAAAVVYDAADAALARKADVLLVDSAGRMHNREPLMAELAKMSRALGKRLPGAPDETWAVLDATLGRNALLQARAFHEVTPLTGLVLTKLDGSSRAGFLFSIRDELGLPVRMVGLGEGPDDLADFDPSAFVGALLAGEEEGPA